MVLLWCVGVIDIVLLVLIGILVLFGLMCGFVGIVVVMLFWLLVGWVVFLFGNDVVYWWVVLVVFGIGYYVGGYLGVFLVVMIVVGGIGMLIKVVVKVICFIGVDCLLGGVLGLVCGVFLGCVLLMFVVFMLLFDEVVWCDFQVCLLFQFGVCWMQVQLFEVVLLEVNLL